MIQYIRNNKIDRHKWDACIAKAVNAIPYAHSWYLDIAAEKKWDALVLDDYKAVFPLPYKNRVLFKQIYQPFFVQQLGIFYSDKKRQQVDEWITAIPNIFRKIYIQLNASNEIKKTSLKQKTKLTHHIDLSDDYRTLSGNYSENLRRNLKKSQKQALVITKNIKPSQLIELRGKFLGDELKDSQDKADALRLKKIMQKAIQLKKGFISGVENESGELLAAVFFLKDDNYLIYLSAVSSDQGKEKHAMTFLIDHVLQENAGSGLIFDFEGSMIPGVARYYKSFGAVEISFPVLNK